MKIFKKGQKNRRGALALALTGLTLALLLTLTTHATSYDGYPTEDTSLLSELKAKLHPGAGEQYVNGRITLDPGIGALPNITTYFDARAVDTNGEKRPSFFQASKNAAHSVLASLYDFMVVDGPLFIGLPLGAFQSSVGNGTEFGFATNSGNNVVDLWTTSYGTGYNQYSATLQKVNVAGAVRSSALSHQYSDPQRVCVDAKGRFTLDCPSSSGGTTQTYSCTGTAPANASLCAGDDQGLSQDTQITLVSTCTNTQKCEYTCNTGYHEHNGVCEEDATYDWEAGDWGPCQGGSAARCEGTWTTQGSGACVGDGHITSSQGGTGCSDQDTESKCNDFNSTIQSSSCGGQGVSCGGSCSWDADVETHSCSASNPQSRSACESQNSACTWVEAQRKARTRPVYCVESGTSNVVDDSNCDPAQRPDDTELCALSVLETVYCDDSHHEYGATKKVLVSGQPNQNVNYTTSIHIGHGGESRVYDENGGNLSPQGTLQLDSNGRNIIYVKACGGPSLNCDASQGNASASFTDTDTNETVSVSGAGQAAAGC